MTTVGCEDKPLLQDEDDSALFGNGTSEDNSIELPPSTQVEFRPLNRTISKEGLISRSGFRNSHGTVPVEEYENDDVFDQNIKSEFDKEPSSSSVTRSQSDSILPDLVLSSASTKSDGEFATSIDEGDQNLSPDVLNQIQNVTLTGNYNQKGDNSQRSSLEDGESLSTLGSLPNKNAVRRPSIKRSVSFQEGLKNQKDQDGKVRERRKEYRMSSGYGTGDSKTSSLQSQLSCVSNISNQSQECGEDCRRQENEVQTEGNHLIPNVLDSLASVSLSYEGNKHSVNIRVNLERNSDRASEQYSSNSSTVHSTANPNFKQSTANPTFYLQDEIEQIPEVVHSILNQNSLSQDEWQSDIGNGDNLMPVLSILNSDVSQDAGGSSEDKNHSKMAPKSPCENTEPINIPGSHQDDASVMLPNFDELLTSDDNNRQSNIPFSPFNYIVSPHGQVAITKELIQRIIDDYCTQSHSSTSRSPPFSMRVPDQVPVTPADLSHKGSSAPPSSVGLSQIQQQFLQHPDLFNFDMEILNLTKRMWISPLIPSASALPSTTSFENSLKVSVKCVEKAARCVDRDCDMDRCNIMKRALIGLQHALDGFLSPSASPEVQDLCSSLYGHAQKCEDSQVRCRVPWCFVLRGHSEESPNSYSQIFGWIRSRFATPLMVQDVIPQEPPDKFIKLTESHHHDQSTEFDAACPLGIPGRFSNVTLIVETRPPISSFDAEVSTMDNLYVLKRILHDESDFDQTEVYMRILNQEHPNLVRHYWMSVYPQQTNVCTQFIQGGTLDTELQTQILFDPLMVLQLMSEILEGVMFLHQNGILYLYWTLDNILLDAVNKRIVINNLTLSVMLDGEFDPGFTKQSLPPCVVPPELLLNAALTTSSDCWGAACIMTHLLTGRQVWHQFRHYTKDQLWQKVKDGICPISDVENMIKHQMLLAILKLCFKVNESERIQFSELLKQIKAELNQTDTSHTSNS